MKKIASTLLTEDQFWTIIENSNNGEDLENELFKLSEDEIFGYKYWWSYFHRQSYNQALWAVAYVVLGGCSDDSFDYFRFWLLTRGKAVYMNAIQDADTLCDEFLKDKEYPAWEEVAYIPIEVLKKKFNKDIYIVEANYDFGERSRPEIVFDWDENDEESIRKICPKTFDKWWRNDKL